MTTLSIGLALLLTIALLLLLIPLAQKKSQHKPQENQSSEDKTTKYSMIAISLFIPLFSMAVYFTLGTPQFAELASKQAPAPMQTLVDKLEEKLKQKPNDIDGWLLLGRSYMATQEHNKAIRAYRKALTLQPNNIEVILPLADAIAVNQSGSLQGQPYELLKHAYSIAPNEQMTLWLLGMAEKQKGDLNLAKHYWSTLYNQLDNNADDKETVKAMLASLGVEVIPTKQLESTATPQQERQDKQDGIKILFEIDDTTQQKIVDSTIFIYAKQPQGMPMPIAAKRLKGKELPKNITLNKADELLPSRTLKDFNTLIIGVKISQGDANSQNILYRNEQKTEGNNELTFIIKL